MKTYDDIIIGFGKGGKTLAAELARRGRRVAMIERSDNMYGGTCINIGCIPTKTMVHRAEMAAARPEATFEQKNDFYRRSVGIKNEVTGTLRDKNYHNLADHPNITVYTGEASFLSGETVAVRTPGEVLQLQAPEIFINTGAVAVRPPIEGIEDNPRVYDSTSMLQLDTLPRRLVIVGGGYIGLEYASMYASFGSRVTILEGHGQFIPREDRDIAASVTEVLKKKGIRIHLNTQVLGVRNSQSETVVCCRNGENGTDYKLEADAVLLATGRMPETSGLNMEAAGVKTGPRGAILVDEKLRTTNPAIRAMGDVKGGPQFTYISLDDYRIIRDDLFGDGQRNLADRDPVAYSVFIDPPLSRIGLNESQALAQGRHIRVKKLPVAAIPRSRTIGQTDGLLKAVIDADDGTILGCTLFCPQSSEIINTVALAMKTGRKASFLRDFIFTHPSMSEALNDLFA